MEVLEVNEIACFSGIEPRFPGCFSNSLASIAATISPHVSTDKIWFCELNRKTEQEILFCFTFHPVGNRYT